MKAIESLKKNSMLLWAFDHIIGINAAIASVGIGVRIIEKHFTKNKNQSEFRDHKISADPEEFSKWLDQYEM